MVATEATLLYVVSPVAMARMSTVVPAVVGTVLPERVTPTPYFTTLAEVARETVGTTTGATGSTVTVPRKLRSRWFGSEYG